MRTVIKAQENDLEKLIKIDQDVIGSDSRRDMITNAIRAGKCLVIKEGEEMVGFLIYNEDFFDCSFISLIIISPSHQRKGYASSLMDYMVTHSPTKKVFSSTNQSNIPMRKVFSSTGFAESGMVENLDDGDPEIIYFKLGIVKRDC